MAKASTTIDISALKVAGETNKYITMIDGSGIRVHEAGSVNTNFAQINSNGLQIYKGGQTDNYKIAEFGTAAIIGKVPTEGVADSNNLRWVYIDNEGFRVKSQNTTSPYNSQEMGGISRSNFGEVYTYINKSVRDEWTAVLDYLPLAGTDITVTGSPNISITFPAGTPYTDTAIIPRFTYDGVRTISSSGRATAQVTITYVYYSTTEAKGGNYIFVGNHSNDYMHGDSSALFGTRLIAQTANQCVIGKYNSNNSKNAFEIGNGTLNYIMGEIRHNAFEVTWQGDIHMDLNHNGTASANATSGTDKDLFNAIRALGWYSTVIS